MLFHRKKNVAVAADHVRDGQGDTAPQDANLGKRRVDTCTLFGFDTGVPRTFDHVQETAQSAMSPDEAGGRSLCIVSEVHGAAASIDGGAIIAQAVAPRSGERSQLVDSIKAPSEADGCRRHHLRQRQTIHPELNDRSQLGPGGHRRQLCNRLIEIRGHAPGDEKPQSVSKTIQFMRPIQHGECERTQRLWQISKNRDKPGRRYLPRGAGPLRCPDQRAGARAVDNSGVALLSSGR
jgi:hypothetical protein